MTDSDYRVFTDFTDDIRALYARNAPSFEGITVMQTGYLHFLLEHDGCSQQELASVRVASKATISEMLDQLEKGGYLIRVRSEADRRRFCIHLTESGRAIAEEVQAFYRSCCDTGMYDFTPEERASMVQLMRRFVSNLR